MNRRVAHAAALVLSLLASPPVAAQTYRVDPSSQDNLLLIVEAPAARIDALAEALATSNQGRAAESGLLFRIVAAKDGNCRDPNEIDRASEQRAIFRVALPRASQLADQHRWDQAYGVVLHGPGPSAETSSLLRSFVEPEVQLVAVEPDIAWIDQDLQRRPDISACDSGSPSAAAYSHTISSLPDCHWPKADSIDWHLQRSQLAAARKLVEERLSPQAERVRIAHLDTGYTACCDPALPPLLLPRESFDFSNLDCRQSCMPREGATEPVDLDGLRNRGHGSGTLSILAGGRVQLAPPAPFPPFDGELGGAPFAEVVEYRVANFVAYWRPSTIAAAIRFAAARHADVISMSMGGPPSEALREAVNEAYCLGTAVVTAAGNNLTMPIVSFMSTPRTTVFPARYDRVLSAGGITADDRTYARAPWRWDYLRHPFQRIMRGNAGPPWVMDETLVAYTPNVPWFQFPVTPDCERNVALAGAGTSAATPQIAAAAAQWLQYYRDDRTMRLRRGTWRQAESVYKDCSSRPIRGRRSRATTDGGSAEAFFAPRTQSVAASRRT